MLKPTKQKSNFEPMPAGTFPARCIQIIHIGTIPVEWKGETKMLDKIRLTFEFPTKKKEFKEGEGEKPYVLSYDCTYSFGTKSKLRPLLETWRGKAFSNDDEAWDFDISKVLGRECLATVVHTEKGENTYANITTVTQVPEGMTVPEQINPSKLLDYDNFDQQLFDTLPDFLKEKIVSSEQYQEMIDKGLEADNSKVQSKDGWNKEDTQQIVDDSKDVKTLDEIADKQLTQTEALKQMDQIENKKEIDPELGF